MTNFTGKGDSFGLSKELIKAAADILKNDPIKLDEYLTHKEKSKIVKQAEKGENVEGGGFKKVEDKAAKEYGSKKAGEKVAASVMWKSLAKKKAMKEDEQIAELSKPTLSSYVKKATPDEKEARSRYTDAKLDGDNKSASLYLKKSKNRMSGMNTAIDKLTKNDIKESFWIDGDLVYETVIFETEDEANSFMEVNEDYGVIGVFEDGTIHCASVNDSGIQIDEEILTELSKKTLGSYVKVAKNDLEHHSGMKGYIQNKLDNPKKGGSSWNIQNSKDSHLSHTKTVDKRKAGIDKAVDKLTKEEAVLTELSKKTISSYMDKNNKSSTDAVMDKDDKTLAKRNRGFKPAMQRLLGSKKTSGDYQMMKVSEEVVLESNQTLSPAAHDLILTADNHRGLEHSSKQPIMHNLAKKAKSGTYDIEKAKKLWGYHADRAAMTYHKEQGDKNIPWHKQFPASVRKEAADHWEKTHRENNFEN